MNDGKPSQPEADAPAPAKPGVRLVKRAAVAAPDPEAPRDKACAKCGSAFTVLPGEKFFLCPACYRRAYQGRKGRTETQVLTQITCAGCGKTEYLPFLPEDPAKALCQACFRARRPEPSAD